jgi:ribosomal protein S14
VSPSGTPAAGEQYAKKVTICHRTGSKKNPFRTIRVSRNAVRAHLRHGDKLGPCSGAPFTVCHKGKHHKATVKVKGAKAAAKHLRHGDKLGKCKKPKKDKQKGDQRGKGSEKERGKGSEKEKKKEHGKPAEKPGKGGEQGKNPK